MPVVNPERTPPLMFGNLEIRPDEFQALVAGARLGLTVREFQVLLVLARNEDHVVRRTDIYARVWGGEMKQRDRSVDVFVRKTRNKLARAAPDWTYIHTHFGVGYRFAAIPPSGDPALATATSNLPEIVVAGETESLLVQRSVATELPE